MQPLDHAAVQVDRALARVLRLLEGGDDGAGALHLAFRRREDLVGRLRSGSGWISVLPSKPQSRPCSHSARKPFVIGEVVIDAVENVDAVGARGGERASSARAASAARPGSRRARVSLARSFVPMTKQAGACRRRARRSRSASRIEDRERRLDHGPEPGALRRRRDCAGAGRPRRESRRDDTFGTRIASGAAAAAAARSASPQGVSSAVDADHHFPRAVAARLHGGADLLARLRLGIGRDRVLEVEDHRVGRQASWPSPARGRWSRACRGRCDAGESAVMLVSSRCGFGFSHGCGLEEQCHSGRSAAEGKGIHCALSVWIPFPVLRTRRG